MKFVIRAGGVGTRLWPLSREHDPKQFHALTGERTMLQEAVHRLRPLAAMDDLYISTSATLVHRVREQVPELALENIIVEPAQRNTGPAVGLECALLEARFPGCAIASLGSDHHIGAPGEFCRLLKVAEDALSDRAETLFTLGVKPTRADTGFGYLQKGEVIATVNDEPIYDVAAFEEKPDAETAKTYLESGRYLWNSNMFVWKASAMLRLFAEFEPEIYALLEQIAAAVGVGREAEVIARVYPADENRDHRPRDSRARLPCCDRRGRYGLVRPRRVGCVERGVARRCEWQYIAWQCAVAQCQKRDGLWRQKQSDRVGRCRGFNRG